MPNPIIYLYMFALIGGLVSLVLWAIVKLIIRYKAKPGSIIAKIFNVVVTLLLLFWVSAYCFIYSYCLLLHLNYVIVPDIKVNDNRLYVSVVHEGSGEVFKGFILSEEGIIRPVEIVAHGDILSRVKRQVIFEAESAGEVYLIILDSDDIRKTDITVYDIRVDDDCSISIQHVDSYQSMHTDSIRNILANEYGISEEEIPTLIAGSHIYLDYLEG